MQQVRLGLIPGYDFIGQGLGSAPKTKRLEQVGTNFFLWSTYYFSRGTLPPNKLVKGHLAGGPRYSSVKSLKSCRPGSLTAWRASCNFYLAKTPGDRVPLKPTAENTNRNALFSNWKFREKKQQKQKTEKQHAPRACRSAGATPRPRTSRPFAATSRRQTSCGPKLMLTPLQKV